LSARDDDFYLKELPTGSDGNSDVRVLIADRRCVGIEINFESVSEED
jgi:hypothetical protein